MGKQLRISIACGLACLALVGGARGVEVGAIVGEPFGVGWIRMGSSPEELPAVLGADGISVSAEGRVLYPVVETPADTTLVKELVLDSPWMRGGPVRAQAGGILRGLLEQPRTTTVYFLFRGEEPLRVTLRGRGTQEFVVTPLVAPGVHARLLGAWWRQYSAAPGGLFQPSGHYPTVVSHYLQSMLARRLGLPLGNPADEEAWQSRLETQLGFFLGTEEVRLAIARDRMLGRETAEDDASLALPETPEWPPLELPEPAEDVKIEPIALRVPAECLYVRFGTFGNFLWMQDTLKTWGGDLSNLVALQGLDRGMSQRMERQLVLKQTVLSRLLGPTVISDVAIVGMDTFFREGAAYGILFEARNRMLLENDTRRQRSERLAQGGVTEKKLTIAGRDVSLLSSADGSVRSFYVADGGYVFVTSSETLLRRFLETSGEGASLGRSEEFRHARSIMPLGRDDTVFVYLSDAFFRNMASPRYWIEISRRLQAAADVQMVEMANLASATEGKPGDTIEQLVEGAFLPPEFGPRTDGSRAELAAGEAFDSLRGRRGFFLPVPDVPVEKVSATEAEAYRRFVEFYREKWGRVDPMIVGIKRYAPVDRVERVVLDVHANPFAQRHFDFLSKWMGPADPQRVAPVAGDLATFEMQLGNGRLFGGMRDHGPMVDSAGGPPDQGGNWRDLLMGYVGTTGSLGFLSLLDRAADAPPEAPGLLGQGGRVRRYRDEKFTVFSLQQGVLDEVVPQLRLEEAERAAQIRLHFSDPTRAQLAPTVARMSVMRTRGTTLGNLRLMHAMTEQLHVPGPDAKAVAELILDARLVCPLGGEYEYRPRTDGSGYWTSTALEPGPDGRTADVPAGWTAPPLSWFRGLEADLAMTRTELSAHVEVWMRLPEKPLVAEPADVAPAAPEVVPTPEGANAKAQGREDAKEE